MTTPSGTFYYQYDTLGSVADLTSSSGVSEWTYAYDPFGGIFTQSQLDPNAPTNPIQFAGEYTDPVGFLNLRARQYDPSSGRFLQSEPIAAASDLGVSMYLYSGNQPTVMIDPSGQKLRPIDLALSVTSCTLSRGPGKPDECGSLWVNILKYAFRDKRTHGGVGVHGVYYRYKDFYRYGLKPSFNWSTHLDHYEGTQNRLVAFLQQFKDDNCNPPGGWSQVTRYHYNQALDYATRPAPTRSQVRNFWATRGVSRWEQIKNMISSVWDAIWGSADLPETL